MRIRTRTAAVAFLCLGLIRTAGSDDGRSVTFAPPAETPAGQPDPAQSAALFVGIGEFTHDESVKPLPFAVNDAIDLAYAMSLDRPVPLVPTDRIALALSGEPEKVASKQRLEALKAGGARISTASNSDILKLLETQARSVGDQGLLVIGIATHGYTNPNGVHYIVASNSLLEFSSSAVATDELLRIARHAPRALIFIDACRTDLESVGRNASVRGDERSAAPLMSAIGDAAGLVIFYAAAAGEYAYDNREQHNGVFTAAVLDGLHCNAPTDGRGYVTAQTLGDYVNERVLAWTRRNRPRNKAKRGIQITSDGGSVSLAIAACKPPVPAAGRQQNAAPPADLQPMTVKPSGKTFAVLNAGGDFLWSGVVRGTVAQGEADDLDGDGKNEVIVGVTGRGEDVGKIIVYEASGSQRWASPTTAKFNYDSPRSGLLAVRAFAIGDLYRTGKRQIVSISLDSQGWFPSRLCIFRDDGKLLSSYWNPGHLHNVIIGSATADGEPRIIVSGVNNDVSRFLRLAGYVSSVFVLDPKAVEGEAPPYLGKAGKGTHLWYGIIRPSNQVIERLELADFDQDGRREISVWSSSQNVFYMSFEGEVLKVAHGDAVTVEARFQVIPR